MIFFVNNPAIKYQFWLSVPESPAQLVFWFHGSTTEPAPQLACKRPIEFEVATSLLPDDCIVVTPLIPKVSGAAGAKIIDPQCLCRNVLFDDLIDPTLAAYNRPDKEVLKILAYLQEFVFPPLGVTFDRFGVGGMSAGGNFASLFSVLHPRCVTHVMSLLSCAQCLPVDHIHHVRFDFPFGLGKLDLVSDIAPDPELQRQLRYFIYHGEADDNDPIEYFANNDLEEATAIKSIAGQTTVERAQFALRVLREKGFAVEHHLVPGTGHAIHDRAALRNMLAAFLSR